MTLFFSGRWDQALVALAIKEATRMGALPPSRTTLQTLLFFIHITGVQTGYRFRLDKDGPFCHDILADIEMLLADEVIRNESEEPRVARYVPGPFMAELLRLHHAAIEGATPNVQRVIRLLSPLSPHRLELLATMLYAWLVDRDLTTGHATDRNTINRFQSYKPDRFRPEEMREGLDVLRQAGLVQVS